MLHAPCCKGKDARSPGQSHHEHQGGVDGPGVSPGASGAVRTSGGRGELSGSSRYPTHLIPDDGTRYAPDEIVRVDHSSGQLRIVKGPDGDYEVVSCRPATEYADDVTPLLRVGLRKRVPQALETPDPWAPRPPYGR